MLYDSERYQGTALRVFQHATPGQNLVDSALMLAKKQCSSQEVALHAAENQTSASSTSTTHF